MKQLIDQSAHIATVAAILLPVMFWPSLFSAAFSGFCIGLLAEIKEEGSTVTIANIRSALGSRLDLAFYTIAGALMWIVTS